MARINIPKSIPPIKIDRFLGQNDSPDGEVGMQLGEAVKCVNWRVTQNYKLKKVEGYKSIFTSLVGNVRGMWYGRLNGVDMFLFCNNGHLWKGNLVDGTKVDIGTLTDAPTRFIPFGNKVYLNNGTEYKSYDGTTFQVVAGHRPLVGIGGSPSGVNNVSFEGINLLNGSKHITRRSDGTATKYILPEQNLTSIDFVKYLGAPLALGTDYTQDLVTGDVTMVVVKPTCGVDDDIDIGWTKGTGERAFIENCRFSMDYSGQTDSRVFLWGNVNHKNTRYWSELANGVPSAEYFTATSQDNVGNGQYAITDIVKQYDRQKIFLENGAHYSYYEFTNGIVNFPAPELNDSVGNSAFGQCQIIKNSAVTMYKGIYQWDASTVRDQTNNDIISARVQDSLNNVDLSKAITFNRQKQGELWINIDSVVWVYNYFNNTWYLFDDITATCFIEVNDVLYFGANGMINKFDKTLVTHNGVAYITRWEMGFNAFGEEWLTKFMNNEYIGLYPELRSRVDVSIITDNEGLIETQSIYYNLATYEHVDYAHWSYNTSYNPQPKKIDIQANRFVYIKIVLENSSDRETATILSITLPARLGGRI